MHRPWAVSDPTGSPPRTPWLLLAGIFALALGLRLWGIDFGLPLLHARPDETTIVDLARELGPGHWNPGFFQYPSLQLYWVAALGGLQGLFVANPETSSLYLLARIASALFGASSVLAVFAIARHLAGPSAGHVAAFFLAVAPLHVRDSHFLTVDVTATFLGLAAIALLLRFRDRLRIVDLFASALLLGLATSTKYNLAVFAAAYPVVLWPASRAGAELRRFLQRLGLAAALAILAFGLTTPFAWLDPARFSADLGYESGHFFAGHAVDVGAAWLRHLRFSLFRGLGPALFVAALLGCGWLAIARRSRASCGLLAALAAYALVVGSGRTAFARYALPALPLFCVAAGVGVADLSASCTRGRLAWRGPALLGLAGLVGLPSLWTSIQLDQRIARKDTRVQALEWIEAHVPARAKIAVEGSRWGLPPLDAFEVVELRGEGPGAAASTQRLAQAEIGWVVLQNHPLPYSRVSPGLRHDLIQAGPPAAAFTPFAEGRLPDPEDFDLQDAFYLPLAGLTSIERPGPKLWVYRLDDQGRPVRPASGDRVRREQEIR